MNIWTSLLSLILFVDSLFLGLLILLQLPKKEAGLAAAFGAEQTAAIFGAGSGSALTRITKWSAGIFLFLCLMISVLTAHHTRTRDQGLGAQLDKIATGTPATPVPATVPPTALTPVALTPAATNLVVPALTPVPETPAPTPAASTPAPAPAPAVPAPAAPAPPK